MNSDAFVVLTITNDVGQVESLCAPEWNPGPGIDLPIIAFAKSLEHGLWGSCCVPDDAPFLAEAVTTAIEVCESFVPM